MKAYIFGKQIVSDKLILARIQELLGMDSEYLGERVDLSRIEVQDENLILVINPTLFSVDLDKVLGYIKKDTSKPLIVVKKMRTFGALIFKENFKIDTLTTNKIFFFAGILYLPKKYLDKKFTVADIFRTVDKDDWRVYIINNTFKKAE